MCKIYTVVKSQKKKKTKAKSTLSCWGFTRNLVKLQHKQGGPYYADEDNGDHS